MKSTSVLDEDSNYLKVLFDTSCIMSTYLVAFVIGDYDFIEAVNEFGTIVRVYTPVGKAELGKFSLEVYFIIKLKFYF